MATPAPSHEFRKLRLNTKHSNSSQDFPFASSYDADHVASSQFEKSELLNNPVAPERDNSQQSTRTRGSSVSFKEFATLDDGRLHSLDQPLSSRPPQPRRPSTRGSFMSDDTASAPAAPDDSVRINPFTGEPIRRRTRKSDAAPRLETIDSHDATQLPSLTSASTASLLSEQLRSPDTPAGSYFSNSAVMSPSPAASPSMGSEPWPMMSRKPTLSRTASLRNTSRRSSRMSGSSMSPAAQFLNGWGSNSQTAAEPKPDDEGQSIGINNEYVVGRQIGSGGFSLVKEVIGMDDNGQRIKRAVKIVRKTVANVSEAENDKAQQAVDYEIGIWRYLNHPHILQLHTSFITDFATFCIMDLVESGSLYDLLSELRNNGQMGLNPELAKTYSHQLAAALRYMHADVRLVHRDVKLENCLVQIRPEDECGSLKLCDFGLASFVDGDASGMTDSVRSLDSEDNKEPAGTLEYLAPELLGGTTRKDYSADIWAFGVCVYTMVTGKRPFQHTIQFKLVELIEAGDWNKDLVLASPAGQVDGEDICDLLHGCLDTDPESRWTIADVMGCNWFTGLVDVAADPDWEHVNNTQT
ncbi:kinase-like protein, partial [Aureobasidium sp. EXF-3399]